MSPFELAIISALENISRSLDMQVKQKEKEFDVLKDIALHLENIHTDMISSNVFEDRMKNITLAIYGER